MDSLHTGSDVEILFVSTEKLDFTIKGRVCHPNIEALHINEDVKSRIHINCKDKVYVEVYSPVLDKGVPIPQDSYTYPLFYEQQNYEIVIEKKQDEDVLFWHDNVNIRNKVGYIGHSKRVLSGVINFNNDIGYSELIVRVGGKDYLTINIEVFPSKIDYQRDYYAILQDINDELYNLIFDFYKKTYSLTGLKNTVGNSLTEFFAIINQIFDKLDRAINIAVQIPHHVLAKERAVVEYYKVKKVDNECIKWINGHQQYVRNVNGVIFAEKALSVRNTVTYDTYENRLIKYIIKSVIKKLGLVRKNYVQGREQVKDDNIVKIIDNMRMRLDRYLNTTFLKYVGDIYLMNSLSLVIHMAPGYRDVYKYYIMLLKGLMIKDDIIRISIKDMALLYEYWCFIKLNSLLRKKYDLVRQDVIKFSNNGLVVTLKKGMESKVEYQNPRNGERYCIIYNKQYNNEPTITQKPDNVLSLEKCGSMTMYHYILDAKYRISYDGDYVKKYGAPGPVEGDINTMHRYRDAIVYENKDMAHFERMVFGAFVLFPYSDEEGYRKHHFYKSIEKVNVGGLPFLPGATGLVAKLLDDVIYDSPETSFENSVFQAGTYEYLDHINFDEREVLVGALSSKEQLDVNLKYRFYHIPYKNIKRSINRLKFVAILQSKNFFHENAGIYYYGKIKSFEILKRNQIKEIPKDSDELYVRFDIDEWLKLDHPIMHSNMRVYRFYTNLYLLKNAKEVSELCIKSKEDYRLYLELKRMYEESLRVDINSNDISEDTQVNGFEFGDLKVFIDKGYYKIYRGAVLQDKIDINDFRKRPGAVIKKIRRC